MNHHLRQDCSSLNNIITRNESTKDCEWYIKPGTENKTGQQSVCHQVCCGVHNDGNCDFFLKILNTVDLDKFKNEVAQQKKFSDMELAPKILDAFMCNDKYYLVMEKIDATIKDYMISLVSDPDMTFSGLMRKLEVIREETSKVVKFLNQKRLHHNDLKMDNIGLLFTNGNQVGFKIRLIDFGMAKNDGQVDDIADLNLSFDALQKEIAKLKLCPGSKNGEVAFKAPPVVPMKKRTISHHFEDMNVKRSSSPTHQDHINPRKESPKKLFNRRSTSPSSNSMFDESPIKSRGASMFEESPIKSRGASMLHIKDIFNKDNENTDDENEN